MASLPSMPLQAPHLATGTLRAYAVVNPVNIIPDNARPTPAWDLAKGLPSDRRVTGGGDGGGGGGGVAWTVTRHAGSLRASEMAPCTAHGQLRMAAGPKAAKHGPGETCRVKIWAK